MKATLIFFIWAVRKSWGMGQHMNGVFWLSLDSSEETYENICLDTSKFHYTHMHDKETRQQLLLENLQNLLFEVEIELASEPEKYSDKAYSNLVNRAIEIRETIAIINSQ